VIPVDALSFNVTAFDPRLVITAVSAADWPAAIERVKYGRG
jgi:hypothetical protein